MRTFYDVAPGETFWAASDIGWQVGHSYIVFGAPPARGPPPGRPFAGRPRTPGPLLHGCTAIMYEGKPVTPDAGVYWRTVEERKVVGLFQCGNQPVRQAGLEILFIILAASTPRESAWRPRATHLRLIHLDV